MNVQALAIHPPFPRPPIRRIAGWVGAVLAGLWATQVFPAIGAVFTPLAALTAQLTAAMLAAVGLPVARVATTLVHAGGFAGEIDLACTALIPGAVLATAMASLRLRFVVIILGIAWMVLANQLRLVSLVWLGVHAPEHLDLAHQLLWPMLLMLMGVAYVSVCLRRVPR